MNNFPSRPFVDPNDYDQNKNKIASYRRYLDLYEQMNEQGLRNHEEQERMERMLQEQVRQGEEARRQLALLKQSENRLRITDGQTAIPDVNGVLLTAAQVGGSASTSAYIEEIHDNRVPTSMPNADYGYYSAPTQSQAPQQMYYNQQRRQQHPTTSHFEPQFGQQIPKNIATSPQSSQQTTQTNQNVVHHHQPHNAKEFQPALQHNAHYNNPAQHIHSQPSQSTQATHTAAQSEHWKRMQQQSQTAKQPVAAKEVVTLPLPPRYYPSAETSTTTHQRPTPHQPQGMVNAWQRQSAPQNVPVANSGQMQRSRIEVTPAMPAPSGATSPVNLLATATSNLDGALGSNQRMREVVPALKSSSSMSAPKPTLQVAYTSATSFISSNDVNVISTPSMGALSSPHSAIDVLPQSGQLVPQASKNLLPGQADSSSNISSLPPPTANVVPQGKPGLSTFQPSTPNSSTVHRPPSPKRTPKDADKRFLARDLLRALKRPRSEALTLTLEPEPKRHAPSSVAETTGKSGQHIPAITTSQSVATRLSPSPPTPGPSVLSPTVAPVATAPVADHQTVTPYPNSLPHSNSTALPSITQTAPASSTSVYPLTQAQPATMEPIAVLLQKYPHFLNALSNSTVPSLREKIQARINQVTSFGHYQGNNSSPSGGTAAAESLHSKFPPKSASEAKRIATVEPVVQAPLQPPVPKPDQMPEQHLRPDAAEQSLRSEQVQPQPLATAPLSTQTPASAAAPVPAASSKALADPSNVPIGNGLQNTTIVEVPEVTVLDNGAEPSHPLPSAPTVFPLPEKVPLFLPSPSSSPRLAGLSSPATVDISQNLLTRPPKGKGKSITSRSRSSYSRSRSPAVAQFMQPKRLPGSAVVFDGVLVPPLPEYVRAWKKEERNSHHFAYTSTSGLPPVGGQWTTSRSPSLGDFVGPPRSPSLSASEFPPGDLVDHVMSEENDAGEELDSWDLHFASYDNAEKEVLYESSRILRESYCRWLGCEVTLNSPGALLRHLGVVHGPKQINAESPWTCQWMGCGYTYISRDDYRQHIERHSMFPLCCPYHDCPENFRTPRQLIKHKRSDHRSDIVRRRTADPLVVKAPQGPVMRHIPKTIPSYIYDYEHVRATSITRQRHELIMPSILRRISGNVPTQLQSYNAARPMPTPLRDQTPPPTNTPYSFLLNRSTRYSSYLSSPVKSRNFSDVGSSYVTELIQRGLVLWPQEDGEAVPEAMLKELEELEVEGEMEEGEPAEGYDVFGPTVAIEAPRPDISSGGGDDVILDGSGVGS